MEQDRMTTETPQIDDDGNDDAALSEALQRDLQGAGDELAKHRSALAQLSSRPSSAFLPRCIDWLDRVIQGMSRLRDRIRPQVLRALTGSRDATVKCIGSVDSVRADVSLLLGTLKSTLPALKVFLDGDSDLQQAVKSRFAATAGVLKAWVNPLLTRVASWLGRILLRLLVPKEWKIGGKVGTGVFGLAEASLEITFGYDPPPSQSKPAPA